MFYFQCPSSLFEYISKLKSPISNTSCRHLYTSSITHTHESDMKCIGATTTHNTILINVKSSSTTRANLPGISLVHSRTWVFGDIPTLLNSCQLEASLTVWIVTRSRSKILFLSHDFHKDLAMPSKPGLIK